jgi:hypothetical protein
MAGQSVLGSVRESVIRRWLEVLLPLYTVCFVAVAANPEYMPHVLTQNIWESPGAFLGWTVVGAMMGILVLWVLIAAFFLAYAPAYLVSRTARVLQHGWVDRREMSFYVACFLMLCLLVGLSWFWSAMGAGVVFVLIAGFGPVLWRCLV